MAAYDITRLQTVVSRVVPPREAAVLTVGEIKGGSAETIIPNEVYIKVNTRANSDRVATLMQEHIFNIMGSEVAAAISRSTNPKPPSPNPEYHDISHLPLLKNEDNIAGDIASVFSAVFRDAFIYPVAGVSGSEDFAVLVRSNPDSDTADIPYCYWRYGSTDRKRWDEYGGNLYKIPSIIVASFTRSLMRRIQMVH